MKRFSETFLDLQQDARSKGIGGEASVHYGHLDVTVTYRAHFGLSDEVIITYPVSICKDYHLAEYTDYIAAVVEIDDTKADIDNAMSVYEVFDDIQQQLIALKHKL